MSQVEISAETLNSLGEKIDSLELSETEQAIFDQLLDRAQSAQAEVEGFAADRYRGHRSGVGLKPTALSLGFSLGLIEMPDHPQRP